MVTKKEVLYRGKPIYRPNEWVYGYYFERYEYVPHKSQVTHCIILTGDGEEYEVIPDTVSEYTGLLDKNGVKIFEGDIVVKHFDELEDETTTCEWSSEFTCHCFNTKYDTFFYQSCDSNRLEVIGNEWDKK
jgi:hypothetical protein